MKLKYFALLFILMVLLTSEAVYMKDRTLARFINQLPMLALLFYYPTYAKKQNIAINWLLFSAIFLSPFTQLLVHFLSFKGDLELIEIIDVLFIFIIYAIFIILFRQNGAKLVSLTKYDLIRSLPIGWLVFVGFGFFMRYIPQNYYPTFIIYVAFVVIFVIYGLNRKVEREPYFWGILGIIFFLSSDYWAMYYKFIEKYQHALTIYRDCYFIGFILLFVSVVESKRE